MTEPTLDRLLTQFERCDDPDERVLLAWRILGTRSSDQRVLGALLRLVDENPQPGAACLTEHGDARAVEHLSRALDRLTVRPVADCPLCAWVDLVAVANAIRDLGGSVTIEQQAGIDGFLASDAWFRAQQDARSADRHRAPAVRAPRPGRNDPCRCGSGRKYKRCHLAEDERAAR
ncbi:SEC-C motif domain protein [Anaeromyxobacter sp. K]|uniref:SEC-C metal-binding domain-containing protein n=1 Tax=Anaeromyxobacter sp. (strain K) TaxID=447217 RepID=UPI00015F8963|nr:SEC-C metal-binding domain-containing protein [Anaeromyxobacter sp. K]ACG75191.1 SEC-C motif domain protein [Anaeromyxobacter sp. K]